MCGVDKRLFAGVMGNLIEGAMAFRQDEYKGDKQDMCGLAEAQHPAVLIIGCGDSRVAPNLICGANAGDIFSIRNVANLVPPYGFGSGRSRGDGVRAAIEYGVKALEVSHIVVFGHAHCGGIKAAIDTAAGHAPEFEFIGPWVAIAEQACKQEVTDPVTGQKKPVSFSQLKDFAYLVERRSGLNSIENLEIYPWIKERIEANELTLHGWWFDLESGDLWVTHPENGQFLPVETC